MTRIIKDIASFVVFRDEPILRALEKLNTNKSRVIFVISEGGFLLGCVSDGDFRRWITAMNALDLSVAVETIANKIPVHANHDTPLVEVSKLFRSGIDAVPLIDDAGRIVSVALRSTGIICVGDREISANAPCYIIAEIGNNHNGEIELAKRLCDIAAEANVDCVKFQMRSLPALYKNADGEVHSADLGVQYTLDLLRKFQLSNDALFEVFDYCKSIGITPLCTPWDSSSLRMLHDYGMPAFKVASADFTNHTFLDEIASTGCAMFCSTGMSSEEEIIATNAFLTRASAEYVLLHCNSTYPTPFKDVHLGYLRRLKEISVRPVGYSGHERGISIPVAAVAMGAKVIEKHITVDKSMEGSDHKVSLLPQELKDMVRMIREVEEASGGYGPRVVTQGEMINRQTLAKSLIARQSLQKGERIERGAVAVKSPGQGLQPLYLSRLVGRVTKRDIAAGDFFYPSDLEDISSDPRPYNFRRPFGVPVRYHDYKKLVSLSNLDFVEFHLSYQDMETDPRTFISEVQTEMHFAVHAPELFSGDHILDLASTDRNYRARSIEELNRVCSLARYLNTLFPNTKNPVIVVNVGGFSENSFLPESDRPELYDRIAVALAEVDQSGVKIAIQTMPPFPWHFGGQRYHNLFVDPNEIDAFCRAHGTHVCFDSSHTMMACNHFGWDFMAASEKILPHAAHLHIVDAKGVDGEGIQIGQGDIDFAALASALETYARGVQFIPEVWQGHRNNGEGFWQALDFLEAYMSG